MVVQETCTQGIGRGIALLQVIDLIPFGEDTILSDSLQGACLVLLEQLFPTADVAIARPILGRETSLLIGGDIVGQSKMTIYITDRSIHGALDKYGGTNDRFTHMVNNRSYTGSYLLDSGVLRRSNDVCNGVSSR